MRPATSARPLAWGRYAWEKACRTPNRAQIVRKKALINCVPWSDVMMEGIATSPHPSSNRWAVFSQLDPPCYWALPQSSLLPDPHITRQSKFCAFHSTGGSEKIPRQTVDPSPSTTEVARISRARGTLGVSHAWQTKQFWRIFLDHLSHRDFGCKENFYRAA